MLAAIKPILLEDDQSSYSRILAENISEERNSSRLDNEQAIRSTEAACLRASKSFNSSTSSRPLSNIFCSFSFKKRLCWRRRRNLACLTRASSLAIRACSFAASYAASISTSSRSSFARALSIAEKLTTGTAGQYFLPLRIYSKHLLDSIDIRYSFYTRIYLTQDTIALTIPLVIRDDKLIRAQNFREDIEHGRTSSSKTKNGRKRGSIYYEPGLIPDR